MSPAQFALTVGAPSKWIQNARRLLRRRADDSPREGRWLGLVHELHSRVGCSLLEAARIADAVAASSGSERYVRVETGDTTHIVVDAWRDMSLYLARLSRALTHPPAERRGRPALPRARRSASARAIAYGVDVSRLRNGLDRSVGERLKRLDDNAAFLAAGRRSLASRAKPA